LLRDHLAESVHGFEQGFAYYLATPTLSEFLGSQAQEDTFYLLDFCSINHFGMVAFA
jgi:hypothetical protein